MTGYSEEADESLDRRIYDHMQRDKADGTSILEALAQRIHDHAIDDALHELLHGTVERKTLAIMGGHGTARTDPWFRKVAEIARTLSRESYFITSGGGPGIMEAANLGAYLAPHPDEELDRALSRLAPSPRYTDSGYLQCARDVLEHLAEGGESLAVPTWFYGHEPSNLFANHIAKYFSNSIREDGLLAIALHGVLYAPGSAGTVQEVFMDACQNHYATFTYISPMVFLGRERWEERSGLFTTLEEEAAGRSYADALCLSDDPEEIVAFFKAHPPLHPGE